MGLYSYLLEFLGDGCTGEASAVGVGEVDDDGGGTKEGVDPRQVGLYVMELAHSAIQHGILSGEIALLAQLGGFRVAPVRGVGAARVAIEIIEMHFCRHAVAVDGGFVDVVGEAFWA